MGARPTTVAGLSGLGDIMLTCYGSLSRNRTVGVRLGQGEKLDDIVASTSQASGPLSTVRGGGGEEKERGGGRGRRRRSSNED